MFLNTSTFFLVHCRWMEEMSFVPLELSSMVVEISLIIFESCPFADWRGRTIFNIARIIMIPVSISIANIMIFALSEIVNWLSNAVEAHCLLHHL